MEEGSFVFYLNSSSIFNTKFESNLKPGRHTTIAKSSSKSFDRQKAGVFGGNQCDNIGRFFALWATF